MLLGTQREDFLDFYRYASGHPIQKLYGNLCMLPATQPSEYPTNNMKDSRAILGRDAGMQCPNYHACQSPYIGSTPLGFRGSSGRSLHPSHNHLKPTLNPLSHNTMPTPSQPPAHRLITLSLLHNKPQTYLKNALKLPYNSPQAAV